MLWPKWGGLATDDSMWALTFPETLSISSRNAFPMNGGRSKKVDTSVKTHQCWDFHELPTEAKILYKRPYWWAHFMQTSTLMGIGMSQSHTDVVRYTGCHNVPCKWTLPFTTGGILGNDGNGILAIQSVSSRLRTNRRNTCVLSLLSQRLKWGEPLTRCVVAPAVRNVLRHPPLWLCYCPVLSD